MIKTIKFCGILGIFISALAGAVPGSVDAGRVLQDENKKFQPSPKETQLTISKTLNATRVPDAIKAISFELKTVRIEGMKVFKEEEIAQLYQPHLNKSSSLAIAWGIADAITQHYRDAGYFLSRSFLPPQTVKDGQLLIKVVEGYVSQVELPKEIENYSVVQSYLDTLMKVKPTTTQALESFLLKLNDLPGYSFKSVLSPLQNAQEAKLTITAVKKKSKGSIGGDNYSSRYTGPNEVYATYSTSILPLQETSFTGLSSLPTNKLTYGAFRHSIIVAPSTSLELNASTTKVYPGYTLKPYDTNSSANSLSLGLSHQWIRQRQENFSSKLMINSINTTSNMLNTSLSKDHIRVLRSNLNYSLSDRWKGHNMLDATFSRGINGLGSNSQHDENISHLGAKPDFSKLELILSRLQELEKNWSVFVSSSGQIASGTLYSSEQIGYGGQSFGKAYDSSEITGDQGINNAIELRYGGLESLKPISLQPYGFYDAGNVWNFSASQPKHQSGTSAGVGIRFVTPWHQSGNIGFAWPLTRKVSVPIYGTNTKAPRFMVQIVQEF